MSNYLLIDEGRDTQELPPSHLSVHRSNKQTTQVTQMHKISALNICSSLSMPCKFQSCIWEVLRETLTAKVLVHNSATGKRGKTTTYSAGL